MCAINDPLGQIHSLVNSDHYSRLSFVLFCEILKSAYVRMYGQIIRAKIVITIGRDCGSASWINNLIFFSVRLANLAFAKANIEVSLK